MTKVFCLPVFSNFESSQKGGGAAAGPAKWYFIQKWIFL